MSQPNPPEKEVAAILDTIMRLRKQKLTLEQEQLQEEKSILTPVQQARYIMLLMNMRHQIVKEARTDADAEAHDFDAGQRVGDGLAPFAGKARGERIAKEAVRTAGFECAAGGHHEGGVADVGDCSGSHPFIIRDGWVKLLHNTVYGGGTRGRPAAPCSSG